MQTTETNKPINKSGMIGAMMFVLAERNKATRCVYDNATAKYL